MADETTFIRYEAKARWNEVKAHVCERETDKCVWVKDFKFSPDSPVTFSRRNKVTDNSVFFETFEEAKAEVIRLAEKRLDNAKSQVDWARSKLEEAKALRPSPALSQGGDV